MTTTQQPVDPAPDFHPVGWLEAKDYPSSAEKLGPLWQVLWTLLGRVSQPVRTELLTKAALKELEKATGTVVVDRTVRTVLDQAAAAGVLGKVKRANRGPRARANTAEVWHYYRLDRWTPEA